MSRNEKDESPQRRAEETLRERDETRERDALKLPGQPPDASSQTDRPDLDWAEHED